TGDHLRIVERVDEGAALDLDDLEGSLHRLGLRASCHFHPGPEIPQSGDLPGWDAVGETHGGVDAQSTGNVGDGAAVVAGRHGDHAGGTGGVGQRQDL